MKKLPKIILSLVLTLMIGIASAQTADEIVDRYLTVLGGKEKLTALKSISLTAKGKQGGMEFPMVSLQKAPNLAKQTINFQGKDITVSCFDGKETWATNFMTMKAEKGEAEDSQNKANDLDFPDSFLDYKIKGYTISLEGEETVEGAACHKIKLTKKPVKIDGKEEENSTFYFFDKENGAAIMQRETIKKGQGKGMTTETFLSDYQEIDGLFFPFTISQKANGQLQFSMTVEKIVLNPVIDNKEFSFPQN
jgi:outer membrane lipoprotein-sorting protein